MAKKRTFSESSEAQNVTSNGDHTESVVEPSRKRQQQRRSLFIRSLPATATTEALIQHFSESFPIKHATAVVDKATKQCKGYGFVTFADAEDARLAKEEFDGSNFQGKKITIDIAEPRQREKDASSNTDGLEAPKHKDAAASAQAERLPPKLIIRNLPWSIKTGEQLATLFRSFGKIKQAYIPKSKSGMLSGFGFVVIRGQKNAEKAIEHVNGKELDGRTLAVDWAVKKEVWQQQIDGEAENGTQSEAEDGAIALDATAEGKSSDTGEDESDAEVEDEDSFSDENGIDDDDDDDEDGMEAESDDDVGMTSTALEGRRAQDYSTTLFIRNLPYTSTDEMLQDHFSQFGAVRYARVVMDQETERARGTGFVCFFSEEDSDKCLRGAPKADSAQVGRAGGTPAAPRSILQSEASDPTGSYTMDGRVLMVSKAVDRSEAARLTDLGISRRGDRDRDRRRLYLLSEGTVSADSPLGKTLSPSELAARESSLKQRKQLLQSNPSLHLSLTRLSIRNVPRSITSKDLKALAREALVGFATDVKAGRRQRLSKEELARGGELMVEAEKLRKKKGAGAVKQAKIVFEGKEGGKVEEKSGGGRSRGYGFVEYHTHRAALMGLRWLNGHAVLAAQAGKTPAATGKGAKARGSSSSLSLPSLSDEQRREDAQDRKRRLIVEFAIENAQVVARRREREKTSRDRGPRGERRQAGKDRGPTTARDADGGKKKKKHNNKETAKTNGAEGDAASATAAAAAAAADKLKQAQRQRIINKKRAQRRDKRRGGGGGGKAGAK